MSWWSGQNLELPQRAPDGTVWHFRVWNGFVGDVHTQHIYFWDEAKKVTGCAEFISDQTLHVSKIRQRIRRIAKDSAYRERFRIELNFPVEKYYP